VEPSTDPAAPQTRTGSMVPIVTRGPVAIAAGVFLAGTLAGPGLAHVAGLALSGPLRPPTLDFWSILGRNTAVVACLAVGVLTFGLFTLAILMLNGIVLGVAVKLLVSADLGAALWTGLAPHFVPEVGAFVLAAAADLWLTRTLAGWLRRGTRPTREQLLRRWLLPQLAALLMLAAAALLETYVSNVN
jgi:uncharacterized membrane protein SpoIIM required for sporulation